MCLLINLVLVLVLGLHGLIFNRLRDTVSEMHVLLKSFAHTSELSKQPTTSVGLHDGISLDNNVNLGLNRPREVSAVPIVVSHLDSANMSSTVNYTTDVRLSGKPTDDSARSSVNDYLNSFMNQASTSGELYIVNLVAQLI